MCAQREAGNDGRRLMALLDQTSDIVLRIRARELAPAGISAIEAAALFALANARQATTPAEISRWTLRESHSTSKLLQRMEAKGLVTRSSDLERRNLVRVAMTDEGRKAYEHSLKRETVPDAMTCLVPSEREQLDVLLRKLLQASLTELGIKRDIPYP